MAWKPDYVTLADQKAFMRVTHTDDDALIAGAITAASRAVDDFTHRQFGLVDEPVLRWYTPQWRADLGTWVVDIDDLMSTDGLEVVIDGDVGTVTEFTLEPANAAADGEPWTQLYIPESSAVQPTGARHEALITAPWGWTAFPEAAVLGTKLQASRWGNRRDSPFGMAGSPDSGSETRLLAQVDPDVKVVLRPVWRRGMPS